MDGRCGILGSTPYKCQQILVTAIYLSVPGRSQIKFECQDRKPHQIQMVSLGRVTVSLSIIGAPLRRGENRMTEAGKIS